MFLIDSLGNELIPEGYYHINNFAESHLSWALKWGQNVNNQILLNQKGEIVSDLVFDKVISDNLTIYNNSEEYYTCKYSSDGTEFYYFINKEGKMLKEADFINVTNILDGIVGIKNSFEGTYYWNFSNGSFEPQSQPFDSLFQFSEGLAAVKEYSKNKNSKWGFVNKKYEVVIPYKFDEVSPFRNGLAYFRISNIEGYINKNGEVVWKTNRK